MLRRAEGWQQTGQALGEQGFAAAGRAHEQEVMAPGRGDFQGTAAVGLALHLLQIDGPVPGPWRGGLRWERLGGVVRLQGLEGLLQAAGRPDLKPLHQGGFRPIALRDQEGPGPGLMGG